jgi:hypothetical protein
VSAAVHVRPVDIELRRSTRRSSPSSSSRRRIGVLRRRRQGEAVEGEPRPFRLFWIPMAHAGLLAGAQAVFAYTLLADNHRGGGGVAGAKSPCGRSRTTHPALPGGPGRLGSGDRLKNRVFFVPQCFRAPSHSYMRTRGQRHTGGQRLEKVPCPTWGRARG